MKWNLFLFSIKIYLVKYAFPKFETSGIKKKTILQAFKVDHCAYQKWWGEWVELIQKYRAVTSLWFQKFVCSVYVRKMSSDSEISDLSESSSNTEEGETEEEEDEDVETYALPRRTFGRSRP